MWQLIINGPGYFDTAYELPDGETLLGRADENDIILSGDQICKQDYSDFLRFHKEKNAEFSANGSFLVEPHEVADKDVFTIGENTLEVHVPSEMEVARHELDASAPADAFKGENAGVSVIVEKAEGEKCQRCWAYTGDIGENAAHPTLCKRCAPIIE